MKFVTLAHPPHPIPITMIHMHTNMFTRYTAAQLGRKKGGFSTDVCSNKGLQLIQVAT
jgi:hypothetical protein